MRCCTGEVHNLVEAPLIGSRDVFMNKDFPSPNCDIVLPNPLDHSHVSLMSSLRSPSPKYFIDKPIENPMVFYANVDLGYEDNMFDVIGGNVDNFLPLGYFCGCNA